MRAEDRAQEVELAEYIHTQQRAILPGGKSLLHCDDCGDEIPVARQQAMFVTRCVLCQEAHEILTKTGVRRG